MGEAKRRSLSRKKILAAADRCVYCASITNLTHEHMPPRGMFENKDRPSGWEFACCERCNQGTRGADALAQFMAKIEVIVQEGWKFPSNMKLHGAIQAHAPGVMDEIFEPTRWADTLVKKNGVLYRSKKARADGQLTKKYLNLFAAKTAMATFSHFMNRPLKMDGLIYTEWFLNGGMSQQVYDNITIIMPKFAQLEQGKKISGRQFSLRYNSNKSDIVAALLSFHASLHFTVIATDNQDFSVAISDMLTKLPSSERPTIQCTIPGLPELSENVSNETNQPAQ